MALTVKQEKFCLAYWKTGNASEAYREAYTVKNSKPESIHRMAHGLLKNVKIVSRLAELNAKAEKRAILTKEKALQRLTLMAETQITDILDFQTVEVKTLDDEVQEQTIWRMKESDELQERAAASIKSVTMTKWGPKIEMYDSRDAIAQIAKMQGWESAQVVDLKSSDGSMTPAGKKLSDFYKDSDVRTKSESS